MFHLTDTVRAYKERHKLGRFADHPAHGDTHGESAAIPAISVGSRCEVDDGADSGGLQKRGVVRFVGPTKFGTGAGIWVGIEYDEPVGKNDGS